MNTTFIHDNFYLFLFFILRKIKYLKAFYLTTNPPGLEPQLEQDLVKPVVLASGDGIEKRGGGLQIRPTVEARPRAPAGRTSRRGCGRRMVGWRGSILGSRVE